MSSNVATRSSVPKTEFKYSTPPRVQANLEDNQSSIAAVDGSVYGPEESSSRSLQTSIESRLLIMQRLESFLLDTKAPFTSVDKRVDFNINTSRRRMAAKIEAFDKVFEDVGTGKTT